MNIDIIYRPEFIRNYNRLSVELQKETKEKIELFQDRKNHKMLKVHKLHGRMKGRYSFSINYKYRIVFGYEDKNTVALLTVGNHDIYQ